MLIQPEVATKDDAGIAVAGGRLPAGRMRVSISSIILPASIAAPIAFRSSAIRQRLPAYDTMLHFARLTPTVQERRNGGASMNRNRGLF